MKKIYKKPSMALINIANETLLSGSGEGMNNTNNKMGWGGNAGGFAKGADDDWDEEDF